MNLHRCVAVVGLVLGPLTFAVSDLLRRLVEPGGAAGPTQTVAAVHQHSSLWLLAGTLSLVGPILFGLYDRAGVPSSAVLALDAASERYPSLVGLIMLFVAGLVVGQLLLMVGLRRAGVVPTWAVVACVVEIVAGTTDGLTAGLVGLLAWVVAFVPVARAVHGAEAAPVVVGDAVAA